MIIIPFRASHVDLIEPEPGHAEYAGSFITPELARSLEGPFAWTGVEDGVVLGAIGFAPKWLDSWVAWAYMSKHSGKHMRKIIRECKAIQSRWPTGRLEAATPCDFPQGHKFLRAFGFELEAPRLRHYTPDGRDFSLYGMVRP